MGLSRTVSEINADFSRKSQKISHRRVFGAPVDKPVCFLEGPSIARGTSIPDPADRRPTRRHDIADYSWRATIWAIQDYFWSPPGLCISSSSFLYCIDWILARCMDAIGITVGSFRFTDQEYADDTALFPDCPSKTGPSFFQASTKPHIQ